MRLEPPRDWINAIAMLHRKPSPILAPDPAKGTTRCFLIEAVGPEAAEDGYCVGDIVVAKSVFDLFFYGGTYHRVTFVKDEVIQRVHDVSLNEFVLLDGTTTADTIELDEAAAE